MTLFLPERVTKDIVEHALSERPNEACGVITGSNGNPTRVYRMKNVVEEKVRPYRFEMDGKELLLLLADLDLLDEEIWAIYHSHVATEAYPSPTDVRFASGWPDSFHIVISLADPKKPIIKVFKIVDGEITNQEVGDSWAS